jgi:hypothetical protein
MLLILFFSCLFYVSYIIIFTQQQKIIYQIVIKLYKNILKR